MSGADYGNDDWDEVDLPRDADVAEVVRTGDRPTDGAVSSAAQGNVRTDGLDGIAAREPIDKRFEVRLTSSQLARWHAIAKQEGVSLADFVRFAVEQTSALPRGSVKAELDRAAAETVNAIAAAFRAARGAVSQSSGDGHSVRTSGGEP